LCGLIIIIFLVIKLLEKSKGKNHKHRQHPPSLVSNISIVFLLLTESNRATVFIFPNLPESSTCFRGELSALVGRVNIKMKIRQERQGEDGVDIIGKIKQFCEVYM
jgi:hypothetical protein